MIDDNFTGNMIKQGWLSDAWKVLQVVYWDNVKENIYDVAVVGLFPVSDVYGNVKTKTVGIVLMPKTKFYKINPGNFLIENLEKIANCEFNLDGIGDK
jgi:hypothetical protein